MADKQKYISALRDAIWCMHGCSSVYLKTQHVHETFKGKTVWNGDVEVFNLMRHPKARRAYAWAQLSNGEAQERFVVVLEIAPVTDAKTAVKASIVADSTTGNPGQ